VQLDLEPEAVTLHPLGAGNWGPQQVIALGSQFLMVRGAETWRDERAIRPLMGEPLLADVLAMLGAEVDRLGLRQAVVGYIPPFAWVSGVGVAAHLSMTFDREALLSLSRRQQPAALH